MKTSFRFQAVAFPFLFAFVAAAGAQPPPLRPIGDLERQVAFTYRYGDKLDPCELSFAQKNLRLGLARALDLRREDFEDYFRTTANAARATSLSAPLKVGPLTLVSRANVLKSFNEKKLGVDGWISTTSGWVDFEREFQAIKGDRIGPRWVRLLDLVKATIADDYLRGVRRRWMGITIEGVSQATVLSERIIGCLTEKKCVPLQNADDFRQALNLTPRAFGYFGDYRRATTESASRRALKILLGEIRPFVAYFDPVKQKAVRRFDTHTILISLDAGDFRGFETDLGEVIEKFWRVGADSIKVEWMTYLRDEPIFKFFFLPTPKSLSQVDSPRHMLKLGQETTESVPAHQVGRALGFRPRYFSVWRSEACKYEDQSKPDDLLSDGRTGTVTSAHWEALKRVYPEKF